MEQCARGRFFACAHIFTAGRRTLDRLLSWPSRPSQWGPPPATECQARSPGARPHRYRTSHSQVWPPPPPPWDSGRLSIPLPEPCPLHGDHFCGCFELPPVMHGFLLSMDACAPPHRRTPSHLLYPPGGPSGAYIFPPVHPTPGVCLCAPHSCQECRTSGRLAFMPGPPGPRLSCQSQISPVVLAPASPFPLYNHPASSAPPEFIAL